MTELLYVLPALFLIGGFFGDLIGGVGDGLGYMAGGGPLQELPGIGDTIESLSRKALPIVGGMVGGPLGGMAGGALSQMGADGGSVQGGIQQGLLGGGIGLAGDMLGEANADRDRARQLTNAGLERSRQAIDFNLGNHNRLAPVRNQFLQGAAGYRDTTNPFAKGAMDVSAAMEPVAGMGGPPTSMQGGGGGGGIWQMLQGQGHPVTQPGGGGGQAQGRGQMTGPAPGGGGQAPQPGRTNVAPDGSTPSGPVSGGLADMFSQMGGTPPIMPGPSQGPGATRQDVGMNPAPMRLR